MNSIKLIGLILGSILLAIGILVLVDAAAPQEFQYKQHDFIYFPGKGIIHSPECHKCAITFERI